MPRKRDFEEACKSGMPKRVESPTFLENFESRVQIRLSDPVKKDPHRHMNPTGQQKAKHLKPKCSEYRD